MSFIVKGIDLPKDGELHLVITKNGIICGAEYLNQIKHAYPLNLEAEAIQIEKDQKNLIKMTYCKGFNDGFEHAREVISRYVKAVGYNIIIPKDLYDIEES